MAARRRRPVLLGDIGGTNARFALLEPDGRIHDLRTLKSADHRDLRAAALAFLDGAGHAEPDRAALAIAAPITRDRVRFTNRGWSFSIAGLRKGLGLRDIRVVNDFVANALAVPHLRPRESMAVGGGRARAGAPVVVLGPGTGLGVAALVPHEGRWLPVATEGGHATLAAADAREAAIIAALRGRNLHVSAERALSGPGLVALAGAIAVIDGSGPAPTDPERITVEGVAGRDPLCRAVVDSFLGFLGGFAGNLALSYGALGGVYIAGGIVPDFAAYVSRSPFRRQFEAKGRFRAYLAEIPVRIVTRAEPAFLGLKALAEGD
ncbi:MAG: glucokinase [Rhodospirillaceae bacterium]